jgi:hypothetical protein
MWGTRQKKKNTIVTGGKIFFSPFRLSLSFWFTSIYTTFMKKKHCSNKMNQNLDHASHVREHQKKPYEQGKNVFFFPISTRGKKVFATREKKSSSTKNTMKSGKNSYITG